jgi:nucleotide-binding universal stress UspA family protein
MGAVVVGVDGSDPSVEALRFAAAEARFRGLPLRVVHAWMMPVTGSWPAGPGLDREPFERQARGTVERALAAVGSELAGLAVETIVELGSASAVLFGHCTADDIVVVGSRGQGGFRGLLLGSVSQQVVLHAPCPVVVVRGGRSAGGPSR